MNILRVSIVAVLATMCVAGLAQSQTNTSYFSVNCLKVKPEKDSEFRKWAQDTLHKYAQARVDSGALTTWYLLRAVQPQGIANECDYMVTGFYPSVPPKAMAADELDAVLKKADLGVTAQQFRESRDALSQLAATGIWRLLAQTGNTQKSDYLMINYTKVKDFDKWIDTETKVWQPFSKELVKENITRGWSADIRVVPNGTAMQYDAVTVDVFPSWDAYFTFGANPKLAELWKKVHPDVDFDRAFAGYEQVRTEVNRELWVAEDVITAAK